MNEILQSLIYDFASIPTIHFIDNIKVFYFGTICNLAFSAKLWIKTFGW